MVFLVLFSSIYLISDFVVFQVVLCIKVPVTPQPLWEFKAPELRIHKAIGGCYGRPTDVALCSVDGGRGGEEKFLHFKLQMLQTFTVVG